MIQDFSTIIQKDISVIIKYVRNNDDYRNKVHIEKIRLAIAGILSTIGMGVSAVIILKAVLIPTSSTLSILFRVAFGGIFYATCHDVFVLSKNFFTLKKQVKEHLEHLSSKGLGTLDQLKEISKMQLVHFVIKDVYFNVFWNYLNKKYEIIPIENKKFSFF